MKLLAGTTPDAPATTETVPSEQPARNSVPDVAPVDSAPVEAPVPVVEQELPVISEGDPLARLENSAHRRRLGSSRPGSRSPT